MSTESEIKRHCAYHPAKTAETLCGSCDKPLCLIDIFTWAPIGDNPMEICAECEDFFKGKDKGKRDQFRLRAFAAFVAAVAFFGVTPGLREVL